LETLVVCWGVWLNVSDEDTCVVASFEADSEGFFGFVKDYFTFVGIVECAG